MNHDPTSTWSPMVSGPEEDFGNFLEFADLQLNFPPFDTQTHDVRTGPPEQVHPGFGMDSNMENAAAAAGMMGLKEADINSVLDPQLMDMQTTMPELVHGASAESLMGLDMQAQLFHQRQQQQFHQHQHQQRIAQAQYQRHGIVPPTPNSIEMHPGQAQHYAHVDRQTRAMYEHYQRKQQDNMIFTPLVSPAVTPVDAQFRMPEYTIPGEYFSPLTSPALEAQNIVSQRSVYGKLRGSDTSDTTSPVDMNLDSNITLTSGGTPATGRKAKRKTNSTSTKNPARAVRQSPAMKPQARKKQSSTSIPAKEVDEVLQGAQKSKANGVNQHVRDKLALPYSQDSSETGSISPEALSDILMPPPATPRPGSVGKSPHLAAQRKNTPPAPPSTTTTTTTKNAPATPASLMRIQKPTAKPSSSSTNQTLAEATSRAEAEMEQIMEDIPLLEPSSSRKPNLPNIDTTVANADRQATPTLSTRRPLTSTPTTATASVFPSPALGALASPRSGTVPTGKRPDTKPTIRTGKKRNSTTSTTASPALRPRISPSIKPLLPEGTPLTSQTSALLLASKSNYQNILEGTHLPGVSYPEALSTNLTSKRTSHKIAEQGRRNRINNALQEIASLLPPPPPTPSPAILTPNGLSAGAPSVAGGEAGVGGGLGGDGVKGGGVVVMATTASSPLSAAAQQQQQSNSKASTVESAIEYIKALQQELRDVRARLEVAEGRLRGRGLEGEIKQGEGG